MSSTRAQQLAGRAFKDVPLGAPSWCPAPWAPSLAPAGVQVGSFRLEGRPICDVRSARGDWIGRVALETDWQAQQLGDAFTAIPEMVEALTLAQAALQSDLSVRDDQVGAIVRVTAKRAIAKALLRIAWLPRE